jgi:hypothetical protein
VLADVSANQNKNNAKIEGIESTLVGISQNLKAIQEKSKHSDPNRAEIDIIKRNLESIQTKNEHADPEQAENIRKISVVEANQIRMMETLAILQKENYIMWKEIMQTKKHTDPKRLESIKKVSPADQNQPQMLELLSSIMSYSNSMRERLDKIEKNITPKVGETTDLSTPKMERATDVGAPNFPNKVSSDTVSPKPQGKSANRKISALVPRRKQLSCATQTSRHLAPYLAPTPPLPAYLHPPHPAKITP